MFDADNNEIVSARFDAATGATTYFAIKANGIVKSGILMEEEITLGNEFEKFRRVPLSNGSDVTEIISVEDSSGNIYHQVDNLAQEVVFVETTNNNALRDGVRSILKPFVATRRFVLQQDDTGTYLQFGFGSEEEDSTGVTDPAKIALKLHGKKTISNNSFDPTKLLSTNKLGISPFNTTLKIRYTINELETTSVPLNSITRVVDQEIIFNNLSSLDGDEVAFVKNSLEVTNESPVSSTGADITLEELKQRAISSYSSQGRAVTKQDYESLIYNMPPKFGGIKRASIVNDPSSTNRRLSLYVISEGSNGNLLETHGVIKNNLKNWLSKYKILNDTIDIYDAKVVNFEIDFVAMADRRYDPDAVLVSCIEDLQDYFSETLYIGEPLYLTRLYERLNNVKGVVDVKNVIIKNKTGGRYSSISMDLDEAMARDGTYIKVPKNVILELKYPNVDIKGTIK